MKKVILLTLWSLALSAPMFYMVSCGPTREEIEQMEKEKIELLKTLDPKKHSEEMLRQAGYEIIVIDGCEYISNSKSIIHKGNCKNHNNSQVNE